MSSRAASLVFPLLLLFHVLTTWLKLMICCALALRTFFFKPVTNLAKLKQKVIEVLCPGFFESELIARGQLGPLWNNLREQPHYIQSFVKQMQPPS